MTRLTGLALAWLFFLSINFASAGAQEPLRVAVAANFKPTLDALISNYSAGDNITVSTGSTGALATQIRNGAPFDIFFAADRKRPVYLEDAGLTRTRQTYAYGRLAFWQPGIATDSQSLLQFQGTVSIANPRHAPYGAAATALIDKAGRTDLRLVQGNNVAQAFAFVDTGNTAAGLVALAQLRQIGIDENHYWVIPQERHSPIEQQLVVLRQADKGAEEFLAYLASEEARSIITKAGYELGTGDD